MRTPEKASDLGAFAFPEPPNRGGMTMEAPRPSILGGYRPGLRSVVGASATAYGYTLTVGPTSMLLTHAYGPPKPVRCCFLRRGDPGLRWWGLLPSGCERAFRRSSETDPPVGKFPFHLRRVGCGCGLSGGHPAPDALGWPGSVRGDGHVPDGRGVRERCGRSGAKEELGFGAPRTHSARSASEF